MKIVKVLKEIIGNLDLTEATKTPKPTPLKPNNITNILVTKKVIKLLNGTWVSPNGKIINIDI